MERLTITLPPERAKRIKQAVAEGRADSVSAYVAHVLESYEQKQSFLSDADRRWLEAEPRDPKLDAWLEDTTTGLGWKK